IKFKISDLTHDHIGQLPRYNIGFVGQIIWMKYNGGCFYTHILSQEPPSIPCNIDLYFLRERCHRYHPGIVVAYLERVIYIYGVIMLHGVKEPEGRCSKHAKSERFPVGTDSQYFWPWLHNRFFNQKIYYRNLFKIATAIAP